jgi:hypothetical protein
MESFGSDFFNAFSIKQLEMMATIFKSRASREISQTCKNWTMCYI